MKLLKLGYTVEVAGKRTTLGVDLDGVKVLLLGGANAKVAVTLLEGLLSKDFAGSSHTCTRRKGTHLMTKIIDAELEMDECKIVGKHSQVTIEGRKPNLHCITTLPNGRIRSFMQTKELAKNELYTDTRQFNPQLADSYWVRVVETTNRLFGYEAVIFEDKKLTFNLEETDDWGIEAQKMAYTLLSESLLTPNKHRRIVLINHADVLNAAQILDVARMLKNMRNHGLIIITDGVAQKDIHEENLVTCRSMK